MKPVEHDFTGEDGKCIYCDYTYDVLHQGYVDENGILCPPKDNATEVTNTSATWGSSGQTTWYVAQDDVIISSRVTANGDVHLILADGCKLTVNGGINVFSGNKLTNYGQEKGTGTLIANADGYCAGIGGEGSVYVDSGTITINGGTVEATGSAGGAGIGGGRSNEGATGSSTFNTNNGNAVIFASSIDGYDTQSGSWRGVIFVGNEGKVYGSSVTPTESFEIPAGKTLTIERGKMLIIPAGKTLSIEDGGKLSIEAGGKLGIEDGGTLTNNGKIYVDGTFTGTADNLYYPLTIVDATASGDTSEYNSKNYGRAESDITLTPDTPPTGYRFDSWEVSDTAVTIGENNTFTMPNKALTVTAQWKEVIPPEIIKGKGQTITAGEKKALSFTSNADYSDFLRVELDGKTLDDKNYTVEKGSTIVTLNADFVAAVPAGEHTIGIVSANGTATTTFIIKEKPAADNSSDTGDSTSLPLLIGLMLLSIAGITGMTGCRRRKRIDE